MTCYNEKGPTSLIYHMELLIRVISFTKIELSTNNVFSVSPYLESIFGET